MARPFTPEEQVLAEQYRQAMMQSYGPTEMLMGPFGGRLAKLEEPVKAREQQQKVPRQKKDPALEKLKQKQQENQAQVYMDLFKKLGHGVAAQPGREFLPYHQIPEHVRRQVEDMGVVGQMPGGWYADELSPAERAAHRFILEQQAPATQETDEDLAKKVLAKKRGE